MKKLSLFLLCITGASLDITVKASDPITQLQEALKNCPPIELAKTGPALPDAVAKTAETVVAATNDTTAGWGWKTKFGLAVLTITGIAATKYYMEKKFRNYVTPIRCVSDMTSNQGDVAWYKITLTNLDTNDTITTAEITDLQSLITATNEWLTGQQPAAQESKINFQVSGEVKIKSLLGTRTFIPITVYEVPNLLLQNHASPLVMAELEKTNDLPTTFSHEQVASSAASITSNRWFSQTMNLTGTTPNELHKRIFDCIKAKIRPGKNETITIRCAYTTQENKTFYLKPFTVAINGYAALATVNYNPRAGYENQGSFFERLLNRCIQGPALHTIHLEQCRHNAAVKIWETLIYRQFIQCDQQPAQYK